MTLNEALQIIRGIYFNATWLNDKANEAFYKVIKTLENVMEQNKTNNIIECEKCWYRSEVAIGRYWCNLMHTLIPNKDGLCSFGREKESTVDPSHPFAEDVMMEK